MLRLHRGQVVVELLVLVLPAGLNDDPGADDQSHQEHRVPQLLQEFKQVNQPVLVQLPHLDLRVGLPRADDPLPFSVGTPSGPTAAGPQRERGPLPQHTADAQPVICSLTTGGY
ncbi:hypothetical protein F7725_013260 [Dissostichus mawsoni]|uniref:Secreted protein n=1 Tax=Dissostichus mawsoni TaxID=36200 RepID=A0A7J5YTH7_DISMA|nr:hypothetical protein F7725_013260 [Dissostichus mawsoni]